jgi:hypothetical protein
MLHNMLWIISLGHQSRLRKTLSKPLYSDRDRWILTKNPSH